MSQCACYKSLFLHLPQYTLFTPHIHVLNISLAFQSSQEIFKTMLFIREIWGANKVCKEICKWRMDAITLEWMFLRLAKTLAGDLVFSKKQRLKLSQIIVSNFVLAMIRASINKSESCCTVIPFSFHNSYNYRRTRRNWTIGFAIESPFFSINMRQCDWRIRTIHNTWMGSVKRG